MPTLSKREIPPTHTDAEFERLGNRFSKAYEEYMKGQALAASGWYEKGDFVKINSVLGIAAVALGGSFGMALYSSLQATISANRAYDQGGTTGLALNVGSLAGSMVVQAFTAGAVSFELSYTRDGGFGGSVSAGKAYGVNATVGYSEKGGMSVAAGYAFGDANSAGLGIGVSYSKEQGFGGSISVPVTKAFNLGLSYTQKGGFGVNAGLKTDYGTANLGVQLDNHGGFEGFNADFTGSQRGADKFGASQTVGFGYNKDTGYGITSRTSITYGSDWRNMDVSSATTSTYSFDKSGRFTGSTTDTKLSGSYNETRAGERKRKEEAAKVASLREQGLTDDEIRTELEREAAQRRNEMNMMEKAGDMIAGAWLSMNNTLGQWGRDVAGMVSDFGEKAGNLFAHGEFAKNDSPEMQRVRDMQMAQQMWGDSSMETIMAIRAGTLVGDYTFTGDGSYTVSAVFPGTQRDAYSDGSADLLERIKNFKDTNPDRNVYDYLYEQYKDQTGGQYDTAAASETLSRLAREMGMTNQEFKDAFNGEQRDVSGNTASAMTPINPYGPMGVVEYGGIWNSVKSFFGFGGSQKVGITVPLSQSDPALNLNGDYSMQNAGCTFRVSQAVAEIYLQTNLTPEDINSAREALNSERTYDDRPVVENNMYVNDMVKVINDTFIRLNRPDITAIINSNYDSKPNYYILQQQTSLGFHFLLGDSNRNVIFNPAPNIKTGKTVREYPVHLRNIRR